MGYTGFLPDPHGGGGGHETKNPTQNSKHNSIPQALKNAIPPFAEPLRTQNSFL